LGLAALCILTSLGIWTLHQRNMTELYVSQRVQVEENLQSLKGKQNNLDAARKKKDVVKTRADALKSLLLSRSDWQRRLEAVRKSMLEGFWLMESAKARGLKVSAVEELRDRMKENAIFGENTEVKIIGVKEFDAYLAEFTIEVRQGVAPAAKGVSR
jgi:Tfp pilus assembly protein PilN